MKVYEFPATYKEALDQRTAQKIRDEESRSIDLQNSIRQQPGKEPDGSSYTIGVGFVGFVIGFFICCNNGNSPDGTVGSTLGTWLLCTIIGLIIGAIIFISVSKRNSTAFQHIHQWIQFLRKRKGHQHIP